MGSRTCNEYPQHCWNFWQHLLLLHTVLRRDVVEGCHAVPQNETKVRHFPRSPPFTLRAGGGGWRFRFDEMSQDGNSCAGHTATAGRGTHTLEHIFHISLATQEFGATWEELVFPTFAHPPPLNGCVRPMVARNLFHFGCTLLINTGHKLPSKLFKWAELF